MVRVLSCIALVSVALLGMPTTAPAQTDAPAIQHFDTAIKAVYGSEYPIAGKLDLQFYPGGHVRGYYHTAFYKLYIEVVGGRDGDYIWLDIGPSSLDLGLDTGPNGKLHVVGTMNADGSFRGQVYPETAAVLSGPVMQAQGVNPQPTSNDQYVITATPAEGMQPTPAP